MFKLTQSILLMVWRFRPSSTPNVLCQAREAAQRYETNDAALRREPKPDDNSRTSLDKAYLRGNYVSFLLQRREFHADRMTNNVKVINLFSDSSPTTGEEIQGMVMEVIKRDLAIYRYVLPGSTLVYGQYSALAKTMVLLYSLWLVGGPLFCDMCWLLSLVRTITTDMGGESRTLDTPDLLLAFLQWLNGKPLPDCRILIKADRRLFQRALRISGWGHAWGNLLKHLVTKDVLWHRHLHKSEKLCTFWRNKTWRRNVQKRLPPDVDRTRLNSFTASLADWRYETADVVMVALNKIRDICTHHVRREMFANPQDGVLVGGAIDACVDKPM